MYPSDRVWSGIRENLHANEKWPSLTFTAILTTALIAITLTIFYPNRALLELPENFGETVAQNHIAPVEMTSDTQTQNPKTGNISIYPSKVTISTLQSPLPAIENVPISPIETTNEMVLNEEISVQDTKFNSESLVTSESQEESLDEKINPVNEIIAKATFNQLNENRLFKPLDYAAINNSIIPPVTDEIKTSSEELSKKVLIENSLKFQDKSLNIKSIKNSSRWALQFYATPSVSYRYLIEDKAKITDPASGPVAPYLTTSVNAFVRQQPKLGLEVGGAVLYKLANNFRVKTGLQLNYRQYGIDAFASTFQPAVLTLDRGNTLDSVVQYTNISNQNGYKPIQLSNKYMQLAIPVGFDLKMGSMSKVDFYMSAASQFTYQIASSSYLLSSDFKNYMKQPDLNRKFNMNASIEAFASFEAGGVTWQAGPQIRYQLLPGTKNVYNIQEHLIDYGFKVGVVKNFK
jgi:hypothetical protein